MTQNTGYVYAVYARSTLRVRFIQNISYAKSPIQMLNEYTRHEWSQCLNSMPGNRGAVRAKGAPTIIIIAAAKLARSE